MRLFSLAGLSGSVRKAGALGSGRDSERRMSAGRRRRIETSKKAERKSRLMGSFLRTVYRGPSRDHNRGWGWH